MNAAPAASATQTTWQRDATAPSFPIVRTTVARGPDAGRHHDLTGDRMVLGTHLSASFVLHDPAVSRFHCELVRRGDAILISDLDSRNGTVVDGVRVREAFLRPGSLVTIGGTVLCVDAGPGHVTPELDGPTRFGEMVGGSAAMRRVFRQLERVATSDATVLITGETGCGKELAAEALHRASRRAAGPLVVVDCGAIPGELLESELFGHERGAFTGAVKTREGAFQAASGGTLFLDEIGELPRALQPKLLRALSRQAVKPVGTEHYLDVDVRVVAATNRDLRQEVNADHFRGDLFYRLAVVEIHLPPLRERREDIPGLVARLLDELRASPEERARLTAPAVLEPLVQQRWPGNVRELRNCIERSLALGAPPAIPVPMPVPMPVPAPAPAPAPLVDLSLPFREARDASAARFEHAYLRALLDKHAGNIRAAARDSGLDRAHLYRLLERHHLR